MVKKVLTLCIIHKHPHILLGMKKRGFGEGKYNGFGGKVEPGETIEKAALREVYEESGITIRDKDINKVGLIDFEFKGDPELLEVHIFKASKFKGDPKETEEMRPAWFKTRDIPYNNMWLDDVHWMPLLLSGKKFKGKFLFEGHSKILKKTLTEI
jgi:8-oxo-dGTP diphosphatase / 2-hydroxy-dATP diphosphatase